MTQAVGLVLHEDWIAGWLFDVERGRVGAGASVRVRPDMTAQDTADIAGRLLAGLLADGDAVAVGIVYGGTHLSPPVTMGALRSLHAAARGVPVRTRSPEDARAVDDATFAGVPAPDVRAQMARGAAVLAVNPGANRSRSRPLPAPARPAAEGGAIVTSLDAYRRGRS